MDLIWQTLVSGLVLGAAYGLTAVGVTFVYGIGKIVNFAHGEFIMISAYLMVVAMSFDLPWYLAMIVGVIGTIIIGWVVELLIVRRLYNAPEDSSLIAMFALSLVLSTLAQLIFGTSPQRPSTPLISETVSLFGANIDLQRLVTALVAAVLLIGLAMWLKRSKLGLQMMAVSQNPQGARYTGINVRLVRQISFLLGIGLAGIAGVMLAPTTTVFPSMGFAQVITAFSVVILAGLGSVPGAALGGIIIGLIHSFIATYVSVEWTTAAGWMLIIAVLLLRPQGLMGKKPVRA